MEPNSKSWWTTLPGIITSVAGALTAITGLIIALNQAGCFKNHDRQETNAQKQSSDSPVTTESDVTRKENTNTNSAREINIDKKPIHLSGLHGGKIRYDILKATLESYNPQNQLLSIHFRVFDESGFGQNILGSEFILFINDIPTATNSDAQVYVSPNAAAETTATFQVPLNTQNVVLKISFWDTTVSIPISLK